MSRCPAILRDAGSAPNLYNGFRFLLSRLNNRTEIRTNRPADGNDPCSGSKTTPFSPTTACARAVRYGPSSTLTTVVLKVELAQSYIVQPKISRRSLTGAPRSVATASTFDRRPLSIMQLPSSGDNCLHHQQPSQHCIAPLRQHCGEAVCRSLAVVLQHE
jgi:hypothetical protein